MKKIDPKTLATDILVDIAAGLLIGLGTYNFAAAAKLPLTGIGGIALIFYHIFKLPIGVMTIALNIPIILGTFKLLGKRFMFNTLHSLVISSLIVDLVAPLFPVFNGDRMLGAIFVSVLCGIGYALIFMRNSSTAGVDLIVMAIRKKYPHLTIGRITFVLDVIVVAFGVLLVSRNMESFLYGIMSAYIMSYVIDKIMYSTDQGKVTMIITDNAMQICKAIDDEIERGSTIIEAHGSYNYAEHDIVMCCCSNRQMFSVRKIVKEIDPKAFFVIMESSDVVGEGFKSE